MGFLNTLIVGVDGSAPSAAALSWAAERVDANGTLRLVHAVAERRRPTAGRFRTEGDPLIDGSIAGRLDTEWRSPAEACDATITTHVVMGDTADVLLNAAAEYRADAIVVGPHSSAYHRSTLGGVTRRLLQRSPVPLIVADEPPAAAGEPLIALKAKVRPPPGPVVAGVGYGDATERAAMWAADYAEARGATLALLHVVGYRPIFPADSPRDMLASYLGRDVLRRWAVEDLEEIRERIQEGRPDLTVETSVDIGSASRAIVAAGDGAELVVLGKRRANLALRTFISPRIHRLIVRAPTAVAVVPACAGPR